MKGTGAERLMFAFSQDGDPLKVYGRKFPVFDNNLLKRRQWRAVAQTAKPIVYLPFTEDTFDPGFVSGGKEFLVATARKAIEELRHAEVPSAAFPGELLADAIPLQVITTLAVIEQTDDRDYVEKQALAFDEVLSQYGLKQEEAYRYSVSSAKALGPMQFTNRRGNGTYSLVVRRCPGARLDPRFESGATNLLNAMKAAVCLLDLELAGMRADIRLAYRANPARAGHLSGRRVQRRTPKRHEALPCPDPNEGRARRTEPPGSAARRSFGDLSVCLESGRHGCPCGGDPEIQQREPVVHREVPEHRQPVRVRVRDKCDRTWTGESSATTRTNTATGLLSSNAATHNTSVTIHPGSTDPGSSPPKVAPSSSAKCSHARHVMRRHSSNSSRILQGL